MNITRKELEDSIINITITVDPSDYEKKFNQKLQSTAAKASIKGFRKGKVPANVVKKMYGQSVFGEMLDEMFNESLSTYLKENNIRYIAQALLAKDQERLVVDVNALKSYTLTYELGLIPDFELKGISSTDTYKFLTPAPKDNFIEEELKFLSRRLGKMEEVEDIQGEELVTVLAQEMENDTIKEGGFSRDVVLYIQGIEDKAFKDTLLTKKIGDSFKVEVSKLEGQDLDYIKKNLLNLPADYDLKADDVFHYTVKKIARLKPAELTEEVIKEQFGFDNMDQLQAEIQNSYKASVTPAAESLLKKDIMNSLLDNSNIVISQTFVKRWLEAQENMDEQKISEEIDAFTKELKWTYIKDEIVKNAGITIDNEDIRQGAVARIKGYEAQYGRLPEDTVKNIVNKWYNDRNELFNLTEEVKTNKMFQHLFTIIKKDESVIPAEDFDKLFETENKN
jgi:trigger factor